MSSIVRYCYLDIAPCYSSFFFFFNDTATTEIYTLSLHDALPIWSAQLDVAVERLEFGAGAARSDREAEPVLARVRDAHGRSEEHTSELQSRLHLVCRLLLEKKKTQHTCSEPHALQCSADVGHAPA